MPPETIFENLFSQIEDAKEKLTSQQYKNLLETLGKLDTNKYQLTITCPSYRVYNNYYEGEVNPSMRILLKEFSFVVTDDDIKSQTLKEKYYIKKELNILSDY